MTTLSEPVSTVVTKTNNEFMTIMKYVMDCLWAKLFFVKWKRVLVISFAETKDPPDCKRTRTYSSWYRRYSPRVRMNVCSACQERSESIQVHKTVIRAIFVALKVVYHVFDCACKRIPLSPMYTCFYTCIVVYSCMWLCLPKDFL